MRKLKGELRSVELELGHQYRGGIVNHGVLSTYPGGDADRALKESKNKALGDSYRKRKIEL